VHRSWQDEPSTKVKAKGFGVFGGAWWRYERRRGFGDRDGTRIDVGQLSGTFHRLLILGRPAAKGFEFTLRGGARRGVIASELGHSKVKSQAYNRHKSSNLSSKTRSDSPKDERKADLRVEAPRPEGSTLPFHRRSEPPVVGVSIKARLKED
jgi:hypothetical protein